MTTATIRKLANAFVPNAMPSDVIPADALGAMTRFKRKHGGLWVGGTVTVSQAGITFAPNGLNRFVHDGLEPLNVPGRDIRAVRHEFGWLTGIVVVEHAHGQFRFRCYGAKRLAASMCRVFNLRAPDPRGGGSGILG